jgi:hypothetical protein
MKKGRNMSDKHQAVIQILHKEWALDQGYLVPSNKRQATSIKRQAASVDVEIYNDTDYKATSIKRQALKEIPDN